MVSIRKLSQSIIDILIYVMLFSFGLEIIVLFINAVFFGNVGKVNDFLLFYHHHWLFPMVFVMIHCFILLIILQFDKDIKPKK